jgi:hypothetical protein
MLPKDVRYEMPNGDIELPTWVASIEGAPFGLFKFPGMDIERTGRKNADPLTCLPEHGDRKYSACQSRKAETFRFRKRLVLGHYSLYVKGFILDQVEMVGPPAYGGNIPKRWTSLAGWDDLKEDTLPEAFVRTLVADRGKGNRNPPHYYKKACIESVTKGSIESGRVNIEALINNEQNSIITEFCRRVQEVIWNRRMIKTAQGRLGLASDRVQAKDLVCIIYGCSVPVILRKSYKVDESAIAEAEADYNDRVTAENKDRNRQDETNFGQDLVREAVAALEAKLEGELMVGTLDFLKEDAERDQGENSESEKLTVEVAKEVLKTVKEILPTLRQSLKRRQSLKPEPVEQDIRKELLEARLKEEDYEDSVEKLKSFIHRCEGKFVQKARYRELTMDGYGGKSGSEYKAEIESVTTAVNAYLKEMKKMRKYVDGQGKTARQVLKKEISKGVEETILPGLNGDKMQNSDEKHEVNGELNGIAKLKSREEPQPRKKLKDWERDFDDRHHFYQIMSESYIHGMMDGEAIRERFERSIKEREFELR